MPWSGSSPSKTFSRTDGNNHTGTQTWQNADADGDDIVALYHDNHDQDLADGINSCVLLDGGNTAQGNLPMGGFRHTNVGDAALTTQYASLKQVINGSGRYVATVGGTANAITLTTGFSVAAYAAGQSFTFIPTSTNTATTVTINVDGLGAKSVKRPNGDAPVQGDITLGVMTTVTYDGTSFQISSGTIVSTTADVMARIVKAGTIVAWPHATLPAGWLECNGASLATASYPELYANIGYTYGGSGANFSLPDYRGYFLRGYDSTALVDVNASSRTNRGDGTTGNSVGTKQAGATASHTHTGTTSTDGAHTHTYTRPFAGNGIAGGTGLANNTDTTSSSGSHSHTFTTDATGGSETRPVNITVRWIILALPAAAAASALGVGGLSYTFDTGTTDADPGSGKLRLNSGTIASATRIYVSETDAYGANLATFLQWVPSGTSVYIYKIGAPVNFMVFRTNAATVDSGTYDRWTADYVTSSGSFSDSDGLAVILMPGGTAGATGSAGVNTGYSYAWDTGTSDADPGSGRVRCNNASPASATFLYINITNSDGANMAAQITAWGTSTNTNNTGQIRFISTASPANEVYYVVTGAVTDATTYIKVPVTSGVLNGTLTNSMAVAGAFARTGNVGASGSGSGTVTSAAMTVPSILSVAGSPITSSGTFAVTLATQAANTVLAGPTSGGVATPAFRALVAADFPTGLSKDATSITNTKGNLIVGGASAYEALAISTVLTSGAAASITPIASPGVVNYTAHKLPNGTRIKFTTTGALPTGITSGTTYFIVGGTLDAFNIAATFGGPVINFTGSTSGTHTITLVATDGYKVITDSNKSGGWKMAPQTMPTFQKFTSSGTWTRPQGCKRIHVFGVGAGGGGGGGGAGLFGAGGGAGGPGECWIRVGDDDGSAIVSTATVTITSGGAAGASGAAGTAGTASSFGGYLTLNGGSGGAVGASALIVSGGAGGTATLGLTAEGSNTQGAPGMPGLRTSSSIGMAGTGASSRFGGGGQPTTTIGGAASGFGAGGAGGASTNAGGAGSPAVIFVEEFY